MTYKSTKRYGHEIGLSCVFRQPKATSHCNLLHGYALAFTFVFEAETLDDRNWVVDFGGLSLLKQHLHTNFDHTLVVASDDPDRYEFERLGKLGLANVRVLGAVGCEAFAKFGYSYAESVLKSIGVDKRVRVVSCECAEHGANSAIYQP